MTNIIKPHMYTKQQFKWPTIETIYQKTLTTKGPWSTKVDLNHFHNNKKIIYQNLNIIFNQNKYTYICFLYIYILYYI